MINLGPHASYIITSYLGVALVTALLIIAIIADSRRQNARLEALEKTSSRRRSRR